MKKIILLLGIVFLLTGIITAQDLSSDTTNSSVNNFDNNFIVVVEILPHGTLKNQ